MKYIESSKYFIKITICEISEKNSNDKLEVLIEKGSAAASCYANGTKTVCRTVEHMNSFLVKSIT